MMPHNNDGLTPDNLGQDGLDENAPDNRDLEKEDREQRACLYALAALANLNGPPTPLELDAFLKALTTFQPWPPDLTPEGLLNHHPNLAEHLPHITTPNQQQQVYQAAYGILRSQGITRQEAAALAQIRSAFGIEPALARRLERQPLQALPPETVNSTLTGMVAMIYREGQVRRLIIDYCMATAIVGLVPIRGGGSLEVKFLVVLALILKMIWDIRNQWGQPQGQDALAILGNFFGFVGAVVAGLLAWGTLIALGVILPYAGAFAVAAGFSTATWIAGQSTNQFYTSPQRPDLVALRRAFPNLLPPTDSEPSP
ncbi:MAG: hypothetical protein VKI82_05025 [Leptolyngbya sp.]|nr:hypothetical protein [Leptolyngbya sp.]